MAKGQRAEKSMTIYDLPTHFLKCRAFNHSWDEFIPTNMRKPSFGFRFSLLCITCGSERHDLLDTLGNLQDRTYHYPDGYLLRVRSYKEECREEYNNRKRKRARRGALAKDFAA
jgi:hypothetical protein